MRLNRVLVLREQQLQNAAFCKEKLCFHLSDIQKIMSSIFGMGRSTNSMLESWPNKQNSC